MATANGAETQNGSPKKPVRGSLGSALESRINALGSGESREFLWGCELTKEKKAATWTYGAVEEDEEDTDFLVHTLYLRHAVLGAGASKDERNVVQVETKNFLGEDVKVPIGVLCLNRTDMCTFDLNFGHDVPVTFRLLEGNGPVHIIAQHAVEWPQDADEEFMTEETVTTETEDELPVKKGKRKASASPKKGKAKRGKLDTVEEVTEEDETGETEEDMEEDEDEDLEEEESEEDEESEEEEEEESEEEAPKKRGRAKPKGKPAPVKGKRGKSPKVAKAKASKGKKK